MRSLFKAVLLIVSIAATETALAQSLETNTDRPRLDYTSFDIHGDADDCRRQCLSENRCVAWTYVRAGIQGRSARCWLKDEAPDPVPSSCCVSGVER